MCDKKIEWYKCEDGKSVGEDVITHSPVIHSCKLISNSIAHLTKKNSTSNEKSEN